MRTAQDPRNLVYTSADLAANHVRLAEKIKAEPGVRWHIPAIDSLVLPMRGGDVVVLCARPGHAKTTLMATLAHNESNCIIERGKEKEETVVYATWEGTVDTIYAAIIAPKGGYSSSDFYWGRVDINDIKRNVVQHGVMPIMMIGFSTITRGAAPRMTLDTLFKAIESIETDFHLRPTLICLDYLQIIPSDRRAERIEQVSQAIVGAKELSMRMDVPFIMGAQASRDVDGYKIKLPTLSDVQWSSQAEQHTDKLFGLWRPALTEPLDNNGNPAIIEVDGQSYEANKRLLMMRMLKQRGEDGKHTWGLHLEPQFLKLCELEQRVERKELNAY